MRDMNFPLILTVKRESESTFRGTKKRSIRLEFKALHSTEHDGVRYTMWMTPGQAKLWEKKHGTPLAVGTRFSVELNPILTGENNEQASDARTQEVDKGGTSAV